MPIMAHNKFNYLLFMKKLENLKNREIKDLSKFRGAGSTQMTERVEGKCVITDVIHYDDNGNEYFRKDITTVCPKLTDSIY
ncbi:hypothetical protein SAMN05216273_101331 [Chryseobacterium taihuense]|uniref:Uncharacterized protein n=2 Tax=Chryseobacterium group TaxID=2782232 RepID=A0ABY0QQ78_9FLAO|nr:hypothetical protein SAMN05216273_101331 [Chryseobacterium taihuense]